MHLEELLLIGAAALVGVVAVSILSNRLRVAAPLILVVLGIGIGFLPFVPLISVPPEVVLVVVLPPLLYSAAVNVPVVDLRRNIGPIAGLSVVLVIISALVIGALLHWVVPAIPFAAAVALGAVVAPTDAVAATSIGKRLGMPPRLVTILEGESLVNDATSLVLLRTAIAATAGSFVFWEALGAFAYAVIVGIIVGLLVGVITVWIRAKFTNPIYDTVVSFAVPFISFVPAEVLGASGVLAVVVTGLYSGHHAAKRFSATARINERLNWRTAQFVLEHGVFLMMGLELHSLVVDVSGSSVTLAHTGLLALGVVAVLIVLRMAFMGPLLLLLKRSTARQETKAADAKREASLQRTRIDIAPGDGTHTQQIQLIRAERLERSSAADLEHAREQGLDWRGAMTLSWSGMRGVVTLAAAQSIPVEVPYRSQLVLIAFIAAVTTLLLHGLTLPAVIRKLRPSGPNASDRNQELRSLYTDLAEAGSTALATAIATEEKRAAKEADVPVPSERVKEHGRASVYDALIPLGFSMQPTAASTASPQQLESEQYLRIAHTVLHAQRDALLEERAVGEYDSEAIQAAQRALDAHELRITPPATH